MTTLTINDLPSNDSLDRDALAAIAGGIRFGGFGWIRPFQRTSPAPSGNFVQQNIYNIDYDENIYQYQPNNTYINAGNNVANSGNFFVNVGVNPTQIGLDL